MERRKFLGFGLVSMVALPSLVSALDFRKEKPDAWTAKSVKDAVEKLYGTVAPETKNVKVKAPKVASNGGQIPVSIKSDIDAKTVAFLQDVNPEALVAVWDIPEGQPVDFSLKIKMKKSGKIIAIVEGRDGKFYKAEQSLEVALGGCEG
ncbi:MAG TPA: thiosulfate oxidation carrier protein SoxY [Campylobacteraceae bacterium]|nr:thiosulfate oxidation carrier protein SoxY [Campylobacteraceae bacterium]HHH37257.1 thiosulfate oxidation carrier protein SoxY [Campylobacterota bacterium]